VARWLVGRLVGHSLIMCQSSFKEKKTKASFDRGINGRASVFANALAGGNGPVNDSRTSPHNTDRDVASCDASSREWKHNTRFVNKKWLL